MKTLHISSYRARNRMYIMPAGCPTIEANEREIADIFRISSEPTGKRGRIGRPRRHLDAPLHILHGERTDAAGRLLAPCRTIIITRNKKAAAEATITHITPFAHSTRVHFCAPIKF